MKTNSKLLIFLIVGCFQLTALTSALQAKTGEYTVGIVPQFDTRKIHQIWKPILETLSKQTGLSFTLSLSKSIPIFEKQFTAGAFDIAYMNPYHLIVANKIQGYIPLVRDIRKKLHGIIVVRKDSPFQRIQDLEGQTIAFPAPNALGAALIPRAEFANKFKISITPKYVRSHTSVYLNVILRQAAAGGGVQKTLNQQKESIRNRLKILYRTESVSPHPIAVHPRVPEKDRQMILNSLLKLGSTVIGKTMMKRIPINQIGKATLEDYSRLKEMGLEKFYIR